MIHLAFSGHQPDGRHGARTGGTATRFLLKRLFAKESERKNLEESIAHSP